MKKMKQAIFFITHIFNKEIESRFLKLRSESGEKEDVYIVTHNKNIIPEFYAENSIVFSIQEIYSLDPRKMGKKYYANCEQYLPIIIKDKVKNYDYYWFIEYDVVFTGNWKNILEKTKTMHSDLVSALVYDESENPHKKNWVYWENLIMPTKAQFAKKMKTFLPIYRISLNGILLLEKAISEGWDGHFGALLGTAISYYGGSISQLGGTSKYTPAETSGLYYKSLGHEFQYLSEFRYRPGHLFLKKENTLYHPVKTGNILQKLIGIRYYYYTFIQNIQLKLFKNAKNK